MKRILTIAGSDCSGGAGIQADIKTITAHKMYAMSAITALTAQNTTGVYGVLEVSPEFVGQQLDCIFNDIYPDAIKIGMVSSVEIIKVISKKLIEYKAKNIVVDPVMFSTSGHPLISKDAMDILINELLPLGDIITPNISEAEGLCGFKIESTDDMIKSAEVISKMLKGCVLIKGGHLSDSADDLLYVRGTAVWFKGKKIDNLNTHGTGCTLSSAIACNLANGLDIEQSVNYAKGYITGALKANLDLGKGRGPLNHCFDL
jgi:hydroxymethylpyrimidine/phosphomethylpyrimidine kinase